MAVKFEDSSKEVIDVMKKLAKTALRKGGKVAGKKIKENTAVRSERLQNTVGQWARIDRQTGQPELQIGFFSRANTKKKGKKPPVAKAHWLEFGIKPHTISATNAETLTDGRVFYGKKVQHPGTTGKNTLRDTVINNIDEIRKAQEETLALLNGEISKAKGYIKEEDEDELV
jgi:hypothetical protein